MKQGKLIVVAGNTTEPKPIMPSWNSNIPIILLGVFVHRVDKVIVQTDEVTG